MKKKAKEGISPVNQLTFNCLCGHNAGSFPVILRFDSLGRYFILLIISYITILFYINIFFFFKQICRCTPNLKLKYKMLVHKNDYIGSYGQTDRIFSTFFAISGIQYSRFINQKFDFVLNTNNGVWAYSTLDNDILLAQRRQIKLFGGGVRTWLLYVS